MNIFVVDTSPVVSAQSLCDQHVVKMILESAQMLSTNIRILGTKPGICLSTTFPNIYKSTHQNHPSTVWARSAEGFSWLLEHAEALCDEYTHRFGKQHKTTQVIAEVRAGLSFIDFQKTDAGNYAIAIRKEILPVCLVVDEHGLPDVPLTYRNYIKNYKRLFGSKRPRFAKWTKRSKPSWF